LTICGDWKKKVSSRPGYDGSSSQTPGAKVEKAAAAQPNSLVPKIRGLLQSEPQRLAIYSQKLPALTTQLGS
jgi:hypothetical protein